MTSEPKANTENTISTNSGTSTNIEESKGYGKEALFNKHNSIKLSI